MRGRVGNTLVMIDKAAGMMNAPPIPMTARAALRYCEFRHVCVIRPGLRPGSEPGRLGGLLLDVRPSSDSVLHCHQQQLHGIVSLRISWPRFPWPPLAETVTEAVHRLLADDRTLDRPARPG